MSALQTYLPLVVAAVLAVVVGISAWRLLREWVHPLRILTTALAASFLLLVITIVLPLGGVLAVVWWLLVLATLVGIVVASRRALRTDPPEATSASGTPSHAERRRATLARPASRVELVIEAVLALAAIVVAVISG
ncbi:hypothetical protein [Brachybacterium huguangmaarense]